MIGLSENTSALPDKSVSAYRTHFTDGITSRIIRIKMIQESTKTSGPIRWVAYLFRFVFPKLNQIRILAFQLSHSLVILPRFMPIC